MQITINKTKQFIKLNIRLLLLLMFLIGSLVLLEEIVDDVFYDPLEGDYESDKFDADIFSMIKKFRSREMTVVMRDLTAFGSISIILTLSTLTGVFLFFKNKLKDLAYLLTTVLGAGVITFGLKTLFARARPPAEFWLMDVYTQSFPSGHALVSTTVYFALAYLLAKSLNSWKQELILYLLMSILILIVAVSRVYLGVHYSTDVIAGVSIGLAWGCTTSIIFEVLERKDLFKIKTLC